MSYAGQACDGESESAVALPGSDAQQDRWRKGGARIARERVDGERTAHPVFIDAGRKQRVIGRMVDAVGEAGEAHRNQQPAVAREQTQRKETAAAEDQPERQHLAGAEAVDCESQRRLHQGRDDVENAERKAQLDEAHPHLVRQDRQQRRQGHDVQMADQVGAGNLGQEGNSREVHLVL